MTTLSVSVASAQLQRLRYQFGVLLKIAYDGQSFSGLALQSNATTVVGELKRAIHQLDPNASRIRVCSRTDAGVHAREQYVAFDTNTQIASRGWVLGLSSHLPPQIAVLSAGKVEPRFDPSRNAKSKTYRYLVLQGTLRDPFLAGRAWRVFERLNHEAMRAEAQALVGTHDFRAFRGRSDFRVNTTRTIESVSVTTHPLKPRVLEIEIKGNAFLYNMVRIIVGTLVDVGRGKKPRGVVKQALISGNRLDLGMTAPAEGLFLERIELATRLEDEWPYHLDGKPAG